MKKKNWIYILLGILTIVRIGLTMRLPFGIYANQVYDDQLMFKYTQSLLQGQWLGTYDNLTLTKGITFSVFMALCQKVFIPYALGLALLNCVSATVFVKAVNRIVTKRGWLAILYVLLIYSPIGLFHMVSQRLYRMAIVPYGVLFVFACMVAMFLRKQESAKALLPWSIGLGVSLVCFWNIREDSIWIVPFIGVVMLLMLGYYFLRWRDNRKVSKNEPMDRGMCWKVILTLLPLGILVAGNLTICALNQHYYGVFATNDRSSAAFSDVMSALYQIDGADENQTIWISRDAVNQAMAASETLRSIQPEIEDRILAWGGGGEVNGDLIVWGLREAAYNAGYYRDAKSTDEFFQKAADELQEAFDNGTLTKKSAFYFSSQAAGIQESDMPLMMRRTLRLFWNIGIYKDCMVHNATVGSGTTEEIREMEALTGGLATYSDKDAVTEYAMDAANVANKIDRCYQILAWGVNVLAVLSYLALTGLVLAGLKRKQFGHLDSWFMVTGILLSAMVLCFGVTVFSQWFSEGMKPFLEFYAAGAFPLIQTGKYLAVIMGADLAVKGVRNLRVK